jgi:hypothetical protein
MEVTRYAFRLEFWNELASTFDAFQLLYHVRRDGRDEIELLDVKNKRKFLARTHYPGLRLADISVGGKVNMWVKERHRCAGRGGGAGAALSNEAMAWAINRTAAAPGATVTLRRMGRHARSQANAIAYCAIPVLHSARYRHGRAILDS